MKKVLFVVLLAIVVAGLIGGVYAWKNQVWMFAPKETEVTEKITVTEEPTAEIEIPVEAPADGQ